jgi:hypothetical protein
MPDKHSNNNAGEDIRDGVNDNYDCDDDEIVVKARG